MKLRFTDEAKTRLHAIKTYIAQDAPRRATEVVSRLIRRAETIPAHPWSGRIVPEFMRDDIREVLDRPYRIIYRVGSGFVDIVTIMHYRQLLPDDVSDLVK
jgi:plasmid stabilization system protein ParE